MKREMFENKGITLIALVITIIILMILAGVSIRLLLGDNGLIAKAKWGAFATEMKSLSENIELAKTDNSISNIVGKGQKDLFSERYVITNETPASLIADIEFVRTEVGKSGTDEDLYYISKEIAKKEHTYIYDIATNTPFKIKPTNIGGTIYHHLESLSEDGIKASKIEEIEAKIEEVDYGKYIPIYTKEDFSKIASGESYNIQGKTYTMSSEAIYVLQNNIDFEGATITPLPEFKGIFYGKGNTIRNFSIDNTLNTQEYKYYSNDAGSTEPTDSNPYGKNWANVTPVLAPTGIFSRVIGGTTLKDYDNYVGGKIHNLKIDNVSNVIGKGSVALLIGDGVDVTIRDIFVNTDSNTKTTIKSNKEVVYNDNAYANVAVIIGYLYKGQNNSNFINIKANNFTLESTDETDNKSAIIGTSFANAIFETCVIDNGSQMLAGLASYCAEPISIYNCWIKNSTLYSAGMIGTYNPSTSNVLNVAQSKNGQANIYNCGIENILIEQKSNNTGGIIGVSSSPLNIGNISVKNSKVTSNSVVGGIIGISVDDIVIDNVIIKESAICGTSHTGGLIGIARNNYNNNSIQIENTTILSKNNYGSTGGIIGLSNSTSESKNISNVYINTMSVISNYNAGGLIGFDYGNWSGPETSNISNINIDGLIVNGRGQLGGIIGDTFVKPNMTKIKVNNVLFGIPLNNDETEKAIPNIEGTSFEGSKYITNQCDSIGGVIGNAANGARIQELTLSNVNVKTATGSGNYQAFGGAIGKSWKAGLEIIGSNIENINMTDLKCINAGGIIGYTTSNTNLENVKINNLNLQNCEANKTIGGLIGQNYENNQVLTIGNVNVGNIELNNCTSYFIGGICGYTPKIQISGNFSNVSLEGITCMTSMGGIVGTVDNTITIGDNTNISNIIVNNNYDGDKYGLYTSGIVGYCRNSFEIKNGTNINNISVTSKSCAQGITTYASNFKMNNTNIKYIIINGKGYKNAGLIYHSNGATIDNCNFENITVKSENTDSTYGQVGGLISSVASYCNFTNSKVNNIKVEGNGSVGGLIGGEYTFGNSNINGIEASNIEVKNTMGITQNIAFTGGIFGFSSVPYTNITLKNAKIINGNFVGGITGFVYIAKNPYSSINIEDVSIYRDSSYGKNIYASGGIVGHGSTDKLKIENSTVKKLTIDNSEFAGGIAGIGVSNLNNCKVYNSTIKSYNTSDNTNVTPSYVAGYAGGLLGAVGQNGNPVNFVDCEVNDTTIKGPTNANELYGAGVYYTEYYINNYPDKIGTDSTSNCTYSNVTKTN